MVTAELNARTHGDLMTHEGARLAAWPSSDTPVGHLARFLPAKLFENDSQPARPANQQRKLGRIVPTHVQLQRDLRRQRASKAAHADEWTRRVANFDGRCSTAFV